MNTEKIKQQAFSFSAKKDMRIDDFMVSDCNKSAFMMVNSWPDWNSSGLIIYGPKGSGKTHLAHIFSDIVKSYCGKPMQIPFYDSTQIKMNNIQRICNSSQVIIVENLQANVDQEALFHLFNYYNTEGKYILWTSDTAPSRLNFGLKDLQSRLNTLPIAEIKEPDDTMLRSLVIKLFYDRQLTISPEILEYIINNTERSFAYVEDLIREIDEISLEYKMAVNYKIIKEAIKNLKHSEEQEPDLFFNL